MGAKLSSISSNSRSQDAGASANTAGILNSGNVNTGPSSSDSRQRARSLSSALNGHSGHPIPITPTLLGASGSPDSDISISDDTLQLGRIFSAHSLPVHLVSFNGIKCPVCSKIVLPDDVECHLVMCLTKPRISYNEDVLTEDKGECVICFEELLQGDTIARLPCLCVYHKACIDSWFEVNRSCPEHPVD